jgi:hypothetical protein
MREIGNYQSSSISKYDHINLTKKPEAPVSSIEDRSSTSSVEGETEEISKFRKNLAKFKEGASKAINLAGAVAENLIYAMGGAVIGAGGFGLLASYASIASPVAMGIGAVVGAVANIALNSTKYEALPKEIGKRAGEATGSFLKNVSDKIGASAEITGSFLRQASDKIGASPKVAAKVLEHVEKGMAAGAKLPAKIAGKISQMPEALADFGPRLIEATYEKFIVEPVEIAAFTTAMLEKAISKHKGAEKAKSENQKSTAQAPHQKI